MQLQQIKPHIIKENNIRKQVYQIITKKSKDLKYFNKDDVITDLNKLVKELSKSYQSLSFYIGCELELKQSTKLIIKNEELTYSYALLLNKIQNKFINKEQLSNADKQLIELLAIYNIVDEHYKYCINIDLLKALYLDQ